MPCSLGLLATSQQYFSLRPNQPPTTNQQYFSLRTNQHQPSTTSQTDRLLVWMRINRSDNFTIYMLIKSRCMICQQPTPSKGFTVRSDSIHHGLAILLRPDLISHLLAMS
jgi:hypothetical protein